MNRTIYILFILLLIGHVQAQNESPADLEMNLVINKGQNLEIRQGMPLLIDISLSNPEARKIAQAKLVFEDEYKNLPDSLRFRLDSLGQDILLGDDQGNWWESIDLQITHETSDEGASFTLQSLSEQAAGGVLVIGDNIVSLNYGIDPEYTESFLSGRYKARAMFINKWGSSISDTIWTDPVKFQITSPAVDDYSALDQADQNFLIQYFLLRKRCSDAESVLNVVDQEGNPFTDKWILKGEIEQCLGNEENALKYYQRALNNFDEDEIYEPPVWLWRTIENLREKMRNEK